MASFRGSEQNQQAMNNARSARESELRSAIGAYREKENELREFSFNKRTLCDHHAVGGLDINLVKISPQRAAESKLYNEHTTFVCSGRDGCGEIIDMRPFSRDEIDRAMFMINSMLQQMKIMDSEMELSPESKEDLRNLIAVMPGLIAAGKTYDSMLTMATGENTKKNNGKKRDGSGKGGFGMPSSIGGRMYS